MTDATIAVAGADAVDIPALLDILARAQDGDLSVRMPSDWTDEAGEVADGVNRLLAANQALAAELAREVKAPADRLRLLNDVSPVGIFHTDADNRYVYTNPRWTEITGIPPGEAAGQEWDIIIGFEERSALLAEFPDGALDRAELRHRFAIRTHGLDSRRVLVTTKSIRDRDGEIDGWVGTLADVTAEEDAAAAMSHARDRANEASRMKSDFLANVSHEIRTPMNGVIGITDLLLETDLDDRQRDYAHTVRSSGRALLRIIDDILDFSKIEAGKLEIEEIEIDLRAIVEGVVDLFAVRAQAKGIEVVTVIDGAVPHVVTGDPGRVRQVLTNLLDNSIKFTHAGEIVIRVAAVDTGADLVVRFEVSDTGDGLAEDKLATIFQPFVQADTSTSRRYGGTGLGLAISSQLVALMGGDCGVSSRLGEGSRFWFTIRVQASAGRAMLAPAAPTVPGSGSTGDPAGRKLLLAEDNPINQKVASAMLSGAGYHVDTVLTGAAAVVAAAARDYDAILMDCQMPELNGYEATAAIRTREGPRRHTPIIAMTAGARREDRERCVAEGMDGYLVKPVSQDALLEVVTRSLKRSHAPSP
jgi:PAS domain S-box-containing protein